VDFLNDKNVRTPLFVGIATFLINFFVIFDFVGHFSLPDFISVGYYHNILQTRSGLGIIDAYIFNFFINLGVDFVIIHKLFYSIFFTLGTVISIIFFRKVILLINQIKKINYIDKSEVIGSAMMGILYCYNPWTFERLIMGQYNVLRGHLLFVPIIYYFCRYLSSDFSLTKMEIYFLSFLIMCIGLISVHHLGFILVLIFSAFLIKILFEKKIEIKNILINFKNYIWIILAIIVGIFAQIFKYISTYEFDTINQDNYRDLIKAFSPFENQNYFEGFLRTIFGQNTWMTQTLIGLTTLIQSQYSQISFLILYNSNIIKVITLIIIIFLGIYFVFNLKENLQLKLGLILLTTTTLVLNFGYSYGFQIINQIFYQIPLSYVYRESGKFYSLFLGLVLVFISGGLVTLNQKKYNFQYFILGLIVISSFVPFLFFSSNLQYFEYPESLTSIDCSDNLALVIPFELYTTNTYSGNFGVPNHIPNVLDCNFYYPKYLSIANNQAVLIEDTFSRDLNSLINNITITNDQNQIRELIDLLKSKNINLLIIDSRINDKILNFYELIKKYFEQNDVDIKLINISDDQRINK
jgi:hypothetical protein